MGSSEAGVGFADNLAQAVAVGQRQIEKLDQAGQLRWHLDGGGGEHKGSPVGGELLPYVAQAAHDDRIIHVAMEILQHEHSLDGHGLEVGERLHRVGGVVHGGPRTGAGIGVRLRGRARTKLRTRISNGLGSGGAAAGADEAVGDGPLEDGHTQIGAGGAHQRKGTHFLDRLHDDDWGRGVDENLQAFKRIHRNLFRGASVPCNRSQVLYHRGHPSTSLRAGSGTRGKR